MSDLRSPSMKDSDDVPVMARKSHRAGRIWWFMYYLSILACIVTCAVVSHILKKSDSGFNALATMIATDPNIAAPGECGTSLDCRGPIEINNVELLSIGSTARSGNLFVTLINANIVADGSDNFDALTKEVELSLEFSIENISTDQFHYGGPVYESQLQDRSTEYTFNGADPPTLLEVVAFPPREVVKGRLSYLVPTNQGELYWIFQNRLGGNQLVFAIPHE